ncbi:MAG TPA: PEP-CTERM sorting domain-containing protein [Phycisphaerae bacterium]|nr:PEP-CTERM sorting domain-containing protein [Phycisphaerae bacterium]HOB75729.1 PEP-CTERM sorting domain-containing protein [Phycisphaerae bacterium]HPU34257.1 PEP-CTERM sorting domain-containing protein [Phycisphaerae bacterium]HQA43450.1 PEP-CTERM sorting domain-containing protein [Phycisphaerae bacterium]HQE44994.1 PEP-CTERM sorting domain-containing protein [Phycisphaerae bacterium]
MKRCILIGSIFLALTGWAMAHTGGLGDEVPDLSLDVGSLAPFQGPVHVEAGDPYGDDFKGWYWVTLKNTGSVAWTGMTITPGAGDLVALVQGNGLEDEWGFSGNSIDVSRALAGPIVYSNALGDGSRDYSTMNGLVTGYLWGQADMTFATPVGTNESVRFKVYTDNSYYEGPHASSFSLVFAPVPEPATLSVLGGLSLLGLLRRRSR